MSDRITRPELQKVRVAPKITLELHYFESLPSNSDSSIISIYHALIRPAARHWKVTMEYTKTHDILHVIQLVGFSNDDYACEATNDIKEATRLIEAGFEYVTSMDDLKLFRKRK